LKSELFTFCELLSLAYNLLFERFLNPEPGSGAEPCKKDSNKKNDLAPPLRLRSTRKQYGNMVIVKKPNQV
jgi:hypothetical protein